MTVKNTVLILTIGQTDLQVMVKDDKGLTIGVTKIPTTDGNMYQKFNGALEKENVVAFSSKEANGHAFFINADDDPEKIKERTDNAIRVDREDKDKIKSDAVSIKEEGNSVSVKVEGIEQPQKELLVKKTTPIIDHYLKDKTSSISNIVVFNTHRKERRFEPFAFGKIIAHWLKHMVERHTESSFSCHEFNPDDVNSNPLTKNSVVWVNYLKGDERFSTDGSQPAMKRIDKTIKQLCRLYPNNEAEFVCSTGGGLPEAKTQLEAACRFYLHPCIFEKLNQEDTLKNETKQYTAAESYEARHQIVQLIREGNFEGAAVMATPFLNDKNGQDKKAIESDQKWASAVKTVAKWFQGSVDLNALNAELKEASGNNVLPFEHEFQMPNSLWSAFKIEAALRQQNIQDAIRYTCDLRDIAFYDLLGAYLHEGNFDDPHKSNDEVKKPLTHEQFKEKYDSSKNGDDFFKVASELSHKALPTACTLYKEKHPSRFNTRKTWLLKSNTDFSRIILMDFVCYLASAEKWRDHPLNQYEDALKPRVKNPPKKLYPRDYRNRITHGYLSSEQLAQARDAFEQAELWAASNAPMRFLEQPIFNALYKSISQQNNAENKQKLDDNLTASELYENLSQRLISILQELPMDNDRLNPAEKANED